MYEEKKLRSAFMSAVERHLSQADLVIADSMNYIKGYRYQLYCGARATPTPHCVVYCDTPPETVRQWNNERTGDRYASDVYYPLDELIMRFEEPRMHNRWDSPLIILQASDENTPTDKILEAMSSRKNVAPPMSTLPNTASNTNLLQQLDQETQLIIQAIMDAQKQSHSGPIPVPNSSVPVELNERSVTLSELRRLRRQFMQMNKMHRVWERIGETFVEYLNTTFHEE